MDLLPEKLSTTLNPGVRVELGHGMDMELAFPTAQILSAKSLHSPLPHVFLQDLGSALSDSPSHSVV